MPGNVDVIVLAAGRGSRMRSELPKPMHCIGGRPMICHVLDATIPLKSAQTVVVVAPDDGHIPALVSPFQTVIQPAPKGTGDALMHALKGLKETSETALILFGDAPMIKGETLENLLIVHHSEKNTVTVLAFNTETPEGYGRLVTDNNLGLQRIVEAKDASVDEKNISLCNSGIMAIDLSRAGPLLGCLDNDNAAGEFYLTDLVSTAVARGWSCGYATTNEQETHGVNDRFELSRLEGIFQSRMRETAMRNGVTLIDPASVMFSWDTVLEPDSTIEAHVVFGPGVHVKSGATIRAFSHLEGSVVSFGAIIGPYARLRPGSRIGESARIGNFVEIKNSNISCGTKVPHLSYIGDAEVGPSVNIGAGTITCNYDGYSKHRTQIGAGAFIGSNTALVAPVDIGAEAIIGAGSTITHDVPTQALTLVRGEETFKPLGSIAFRNRIGANAPRFRKSSDTLRKSNP